VGLGGCISHWLPTIGMYTLASTNLAIFKKSFSNIAMPQIKWGKHHKNTNHSVCLVTIDGTDFCLQEPMDLIQGGSCTNLKGLVFAMRLEYASKLGGLFDKWTICFGGLSDLSIAWYSIACKLDPGK